MPRKFQIACIQASVEIIDETSRRDEVIARNIRRGLDIAEAAVVRDEARVVLFPEAWFQGFNHTRTVDDWKDICITIPGSETELISDFARKHQVYVAGAAFERDPGWPGVWFTTGFIIDPEGAIGLRYRKCHEHNVEGAIPSICPADVYSEYVERYGEDSLFPVLDTPYGRLAMIVEHDVNFFELSRVLTFHGAEILLHPTTETNGPLAVSRDQVRRSRAYENLVYLVSANAGALRGRYSAVQQIRGRSTIVNYLGNIEAQIEGAGESVLVTPIDLDRLRRRRTEVFMNFPAQVKSQLFGREFKKQTFMPIDTGGATRATAEDTIKRLQDEGILVAPEK